MTFMTAMKTRKEPRMAMANMKDSMTGYVTVLNVLSRGDKTIYLRQKGLRLTAFLCLITAK